MNQEIERKFLVTGDFMPYVVSKKEITQGYLNTDPHRTIRVRISGESAFITIKGITNGISRYEWEHPIELKDALELIKLCNKGLIRKTRYIVPTSGDLQFEIDVFHDNLDGLIIAEIELPTTDTTFDKPTWLGKEVTGNPKYYNSNLI